MDEAVKQSGLYVERTTKVVLDLIICISSLHHNQMRENNNSMKRRKRDNTRTEVVGDEVERLGIVGHFVVQASKIESVKDKILIDLAEVFVAFGG